MTAQADGGPAETDGGPTQTDGGPTQTTGQQVLHPTRQDYPGLCRSLKTDGYTFLSDLCAVDYLTNPSRPRLPAGVRLERLEVVVSLLDMQERRRVRLRVQVPEDDPVIVSVTGLFPGAEAMEREAFDMMGIVFTGHPDLTRILMPEDWEGHPLRKDFPVGRVPVRFKEAPSNR